jgi:hypothetical protein
MGKYSAKGNVEHLYISVIDLPHNSKDSICFNKTYD